MVVLLGINSVRVGSSGHFLDDGRIPLQATHPCYLESEVSERDTASNLTLWQYLALCVDGRYAISIINHAMVWYGK